jgi:hypothetical protein
VNSFLLSLLCGISARDSGQKAACQAGRSDASSTDPERFRRPDDHQPCVTLAVVATHRDGHLVRLRKARIRPIGRWTTATGGGIL